ncbi:uncharacterized protein LOC112596886 [Melanaphis sacchari]|uniref:uncharacterized protein LOC112596886 n=1 Tax=Melanaphis sacchari TaxID=742174 RepID=UPI000DC15A3E|nr:uncharacterized protein LOC112596886 [Melanaphis sacchari]
MSPLVLLGGTINFLNSPIVNSVPTSTSSTSRQASSKHIFNKTSEKCARNRKIRKRCTHYYEYKAVIIGSVQACKEVKRVTNLYTTFDISRKEQLSIVFRYINKNTGDICERLIAVRETLSTTSQHSFKMFNDICEKMDIDWKKYLIGQSYDGAASMKGAYNGFQAIMKEHNPSTTYVWCWTHRFSLVIVDAVSSCSQAKNLFGNLETLYDYIGSSKKRVGLYSQHQKERYPESFVLTSFTFKQIFELTNPLSVFLQGVQIDLLAATEYIQSVFEKIQAFRDDNQFENLIEDKNQYISSKSDELSFTPLVANRKRAKKKMPDLSLFQVKRIIEVKENSNLLTDAFEGFEEIYGQFVKVEDLRREYKQFVNLYLMFEKLIKLPVKIHKPIPCDDNSNDDIEEENTENLIMSTTCGTINTVYKLFQQNGLKEVFPAIYTALSIGLTLPISSSSPERAFSKLKLIKSKLRSTMAEERLDSLMLISCENDIDIDFDSVINIFTSYSTVLKKILC